MLSRILIVDDNDADLLYARIVIERSGASQHVLTVESARQALDLLIDPHGEPITLMLLDINMPGMNGYELLEELQQRRADLPVVPVVVMLSSSPDPADRQRAMAHPLVKGYLVKPIDRETALNLKALAGL